MDVVIVGGGITGAGVALDASRRGLQVALFEQQDFGIGASTATSKLAHGGLRYLEQRQFKLVKESLNERNFLLNSAPHLVKPLQFYVPIYKGSRWKKWQLAIGLRVYDWIPNQSEIAKACHAWHGTFAAGCALVKNSWLVGVWELLRCPNGGPSLNY